MKLFPIALLGLLSTAAVAQNLNQNLNQELLRAMLSVQEAAQMQQCLQQIDPAKLQRFMRRAEHTKTQIETLCARDERLPATDLAVTFVQLYGKDPTALKVKQCSELAPALVPQFSVANFDGRLKGRHICDF
jgi:nitric oxide reductase activation protein